MFIFIRIANGTELKQKPCGIFNTKTLVFKIRMILKIVGEYPLSFWGYEMAMSIFINIANGTE